MKKRVCAFLAGAFLALSVVVSPVFAADTTTVTFANGITFAVPNDLLKYVNENKAQIDAALVANNVTQSQVDSVQTKILNAYDELASKDKIKNPYTAATGWIDDFGKVLADVMPNAQMQGGVYADALISYNQFGENKGKNAPYKKFAVGLNSGISKLDIGDFVDATEELSFDFGKKIPRTLVMPVATVDGRVCGFSLPLDIGFNCSFIDTSMIPFARKTFESNSASYYNFGGDIRYAFIANRGSHHLTVSALGGAAYTKIKVDIDQSAADVMFDLNTINLYFGSQVSARFHEIVPFAGVRIGFSNSSIEWSVSNIDWAHVLGTSSDTNIANAVKWNILPKKFGGKYTSSFSDGVRPQIFGGVGFDIARLTATISGSYDITSYIPSGAFSLRMLF